MAGRSPGRSTSTNLDVETGWSGGGSSPRRSQPRRQSDLGVFPQGGSVSPWIHRDDTDKTNQSANTNDDRQKDDHDDGSRYHRLVTTVTLHGNRSPRLDGRALRVQVSALPWDHPWKVLSGQTQKVTIRRFAQPKRSASIPCSVVNW